MSKWGILLLEWFWFCKMDERQGFWRLFNLGFTGFPKWRSRWSFGCWLWSIILVALEFKQWFPWTPHCVTGLLKHTSRFAKDQVKVTQKTVCLLWELECRFPSYSRCRSILDLVITRNETEGALGLKNVTVTE